MQLNEVTVTAMWEEHNKHVWRYVKKRLGDVRFDVVDDVVQDVWLQVLAKGLGQEGHVGTLLLVAGRMCGRYWEKKRTQFGGAKEVDDWEGLGCGSREGDPLDLLCRRESVELAGLSIVEADWSAADGVWKNCVRRRRQRQLSERLPKDVVCRRRRHASDMERDRVRSLEGEERVRFLKRSRRMRAVRASKRSGCELAYFREFNRKAMRVRRARLAARESVGERRERLRKRRAKDAIDRRARLALESVEERDIRMRVAAERARKYGAKRVLTAAVA